MRAQQHPLCAFLLIWFGQCVSLLGSGLTSFALSIWIYQKTGSATPFTLVALFSILPRLFISPLAGALVDRWDRKTAMIIADAGAGLTTLALAGLLLGGRLEVWHLYMTAAASAVFGAFQYPAYAAAVTLLAPKEKLGRANGLIQLGRALSEILAPALAGILVLAIGVQGVLLIDFGTFLVAVITLLAVRLPLASRAPGQAAGAHAQAPPKVEEQSWAALFREAAEGWHYLRNQAGLMGLVIFFAVVNFVWSMFAVLVTPMALGFASPEVMGVLLTTAGVGMLAGSLLMSAWGGPKRRVLGMITFELIAGLGFILIGLRPAPMLAAVGAFIAHLTIAVIYGSNQALWQSKIPTHLQGRAFALQEMLSRSTAPLAYVLAGPLADRVFEPLLQPGGRLAGSLGWIMGTGSGRGIALLLVLLGIVKVTVSLWGFFYPPVRQAEGIAEQVQAPAAP